ncbi:hypothetical protein B9T31_17545 [Acinetobacter sp. ANC 4558]|uniref:hypothetical protein n=1 Tax=Acinetobacter sp. ANC 4558 TaxID=1977876 RepID=UPI000A35326B|nr:hypothetical protein [Acinetobacter sp. ANC 4558]OTG78514.1 hypothetical protein B9T31_17545 [Acinetobacter sp. ANC 4558]
MNLNTQSFKPTTIVLTAAVTFSVLIAIPTSITALSHSTEYTPTYSISQPESYGVQSVQITGKNSGTAIVNVDGFRIAVNFKFESHPDSYGVTGSEFTAIDITDLAIDSITDSKGKSYNDFTDYNDHRNINLLLATFIEKNNLVEAV